MHFQKELIWQLALMQTKMHSLTPISPPPKASKSHTCSHDVKTGPYKDVQILELCKYDWDDQI